MALLANYVRFCRKASHDFAPDNHRFLSKLSLSLQAQLLHDHSAHDFRGRIDRLLSLLDDTTQALRILALTLQTLYGLAPLPITLPAYDFFQETNLFTLVTSLVFEKDKLQELIVEKIRECFKAKFQAYRRQPEFTTSMFVTDFIELNSRNSRRVERMRTELGSLLEPTRHPYSHLQIFPRTTRMLTKIFEKRVPLFKLKVICEVEKLMNLELEQLRQTLDDSFAIQIANVFTRETDYLIVKWLLSCHRSHIDNLSSHLMFTYFFMHEDYRKDRKGSCLATFMQEIERIIQWNTTS